MATINIRRDGTGKVVYDPPTVKLGKGDFVVWANQDPAAAHQPTLQGKPADYWMTDSLPGFVAGQPAATSPAINLAGAAGTSITYVDGLDPNGGSGTITF
jgi:plastocyanin